MKNGHWTQQEIEDRNQRAEEYLARKHAETSVGLELLAQFGIILGALIVAIVFAYAM